MPMLPVGRCSVCHRRPAVARGRCARCDRTSSRNHYGVQFDKRGHGAAYDALAREFRGRPCALAYPGCTGIATGADLIVPYSRGGLTIRSNAQPACARCQSVQGGRLTARGFVR